MSQIPYDKRVEGNEKFGLARKWLNDSLHHSERALADNCSSSQTFTEPLASPSYGSLSRPKPSLPSRILDLESNGTQLRDAIRLQCITSDCKADYFTLSYRWAQSDPFTTTKENLADHCREIRFYDLPRTLQDAVIVTREMGVRYLWIDALCIVQDDLSDWAKESELMGEIYKNSLCTITAHCAKDSHDGFLDQALKSPKVVLVKLCARMSSADDFEQKESSLRVPGNFQNQAERSHLSKRGWILQERILSSRILHFVESELFWEDAMGIKGEYGSLYNFTDDLPVPRTGTYRAKPDVCKFSIGDWYKMVENYTRCDLTKESDRLLAILGIASLMKGHIGGLYYTGVWPDYLPCGLLRNAFSNMSRPKSKMVPSWSWASYGGEIQYRVSFHTFVSEMEFLGMRELSDDKGKESLQSPSEPSCLILRSALKTLSDLMPCALCEPTPLDPNPRQHYCAVRMYDDSKTGPDRLIGRVVFDDSTDKGGEVFPKGLVCARIGSTKGKEGYSMLVLVRTGGNEYRRVGVGSVDRYEWFDDGCTGDINII